MKIVKSYLVFLLLTGIAFSGCFSPILLAQPDPICQITNFAPDDARVYEAPDLDSAVIGTLQQNDTVQSAGFIRIGDGTWFVVDAYGGRDGASIGFIWRHDIIVPSNCPPATVPGLSVSTSDLLISEPLLAYVSSRTGDNEMYLWDGERSINISPSPGAYAGQPVWNSHGELAWVANPLGETGNIYIWDGQHVFNLDQLLGRDLAPTDLPTWNDGGQLAWSGGDLENVEIYVWDGEQVINISQNPALDTAPAWSTDGRLAWTSADNLDSDSEIYVWDGEQIINISQYPNGNDWNATWSPDGWLSWASIRNGNLEVMVWDGEQVINVSQDDGWDAWNAWSPDGRLAWVSNRDEYLTVYVWDGERTIRVSEVDANAANLAWSPDGQLAWQSEREYSHDIVIWDGEQVINFTQSPDEGDYSPQWNADGWLAWIVDTDGDWDIHVWDGEQVVNISQSQGIDRDHSWAP
ncbi:MAG: hypothetical protein RLP44_19905 [Aggregatilineales bacterium]